MAGSFLVDDLRAYGHYRSSSQLEVKGFFMDIAEVAKKAGVPASTLRFYEEKGLIASIGRPGLRRRFSPAVLDQLALIALGRAAGFSLDDIGSMFSAGGQASIDRRMLAAKADEIDETIKRLKMMSKGLRHAAVCPAPSHSECPTFQRLLCAAASGALAQRSRKRRVEKDGG
jgi:DNA-binding transcriptional MerR regulator